MKLRILFLVLACGCEVKRTDPAGARPDAGATSTSTPTPTPTSASSTNGERIVGDPDERPLGLAIDDDAVYWSTAWDRPGVRRIARNAPPGTKASLVCTFADKMAAPEALVVTDTHVWVVAKSPSGVYRAPKTGSDIACEKVADLDFFRGRTITRIGNVVYAAGGSEPSKLLAIDAAGKSTTITELPKGADSLTTDGTSLYVSEYWTHELSKIAATPGATPTKMGAGGTQLQYAEGSLFWLGASSSVWTMPVAGGTPTVVGSGGVTGGFTVVNGHLYAAARTTMKGSTSLKKGPITKNALVDHGSFRDYVVAVKGDARDIYVATMRNVVRLAP